MAQGADAGKGLGARARGFHCLQALGILFLLAQLPGAKHQNHQHKAEHGQAHGPHGPVGLQFGRPTTARGGGNLPFTRGQGDFLNYGVVREDLLAAEEHGALRAGAVSPAHGHIVFKAETQEASRGEQGVEIEGHAQQPPEDLLTAWRGRGKKHGMA